MHRILLVFLFVLLGTRPSPAQIGETHPTEMAVVGESLVLAATQPGTLCFDQIVKGSLTLRSTYAASDPNLLVYTEELDYLVDYSKGTIQRTASSRIPDYITYPLFGLKDFDHSKFKDFSNQKWFVWADYRSTHGELWAQPNPQGDHLARARRKLEAGGPFKIVSYGDSITAGGDASVPAFQFPRRFASHLQRRFPRSKIEIQDVSIPGYTSQQGLDWFDKKVGMIEKADLVLVGFGMNDHNKIAVGGNEPAKFKTNLVALVQRIAETKGSDVILFSAFPPNENWRFGSHRMTLFADATRQAAAEARCAYVDVFTVWQRVLRRKDQPSLLANNINHPNDFGHWLYLQAFEALQF